MLKFNTLYTQSFQHKCLTNKITYICSQVVNKIVVTCTKRICNSKQMLYKKYDCSTCFPRNVGNKILFSLSLNFDLHNYLNSDSGIL